MRRNICNLELRLLPYSASLLSNNGSPQQKHHQDQQEQQQQQQLMTIFYNGKICVCDVTEFQARAILLLANRETEERLMKTPSGSSEPSSPTLQSQVYSPTTPSGLSMKRSLQRFLQKRKNRVQATSPYNRH